MTTVTLTPASTNPWTAPAGVTSVQVECYGEGGNGATSSHGSFSGGGGGGGEYAKATSVAVTPGSNYTFSIGSGGSGTNTVFTGDSLTVTAHPGGNAFGQSAGSGGTGSTNATHFNGGAGASGSGGGSQTGGNGGGAAGPSGAGTTGGGGAGGPALSPGSSGTNPGDGGGGGGSGGTINHGGGSGAAGQIVLTYTATTSHSGTATLSGSGTLSGTGAFAGRATLSGSGTLSGAARIQVKHFALDGNGTLSGSKRGVQNESVTLVGSGTLTGSGTAAIFGTTAMSGSGTLGLAPTLRYTAPLAGTGTLFVIGTGGASPVGVGICNPSAMPGTSMVSVAAPGSNVWQYLGTLGSVMSLVYSFICPGGCDQMTCTVKVPADYRTQLFNPGWKVRITRGGHIVWTGKLDEPVATKDGWNLTAVGDGNRGTDFVAYYTSTWPTSEPDQSINNAISRGLPWTNPGVGQPAGAWFGQEVDPAAQTITDLLNLVTSRGGLLWYVNSQPLGIPTLSVSPLPVTPNRVLVVTQPASRTLGGDVNTLFIRYTVADASSGSSGNQQTQYGTTTVSNAASIAAHGPLEAFLDLTSADVMSSSQAQQVGNYILGIYQRASFAGPFTVSYGQLLTTGGQPIDLGTDQAGNVVRLVLTDYGYGGEVSPGQPISFIVGGYSWDDFGQVATITPYQVLDQSFSGLMSLETTLLTPITQNPA